MSAEDLLDLETWKGLAYMMTYSRFQADQMRGKVSETINHVVPEPILSPAGCWRIGKSGPRIVLHARLRQANPGNVPGRHARRPSGPLTWKGVWYMITYSLQFQAEQLKQRLGRAGGGQGLRNKGRPTNHPRIKAMPIYTRGPALSSASRPCLESSSP